MGETYSLARLRGMIFQPRRPGFEPSSGHVGFVVDKVALGQVFSDYFSSPCQLSFHRLLHIHHLSSGAGTISQLLAEVPRGLSLTPPQETKKGEMMEIRNACTVPFYLSVRSETEPVGTAASNQAIIHPRVREKYGELVDF
jgi:hypothetical protein